MVNDELSNLKKWFLNQRRELPWRKNPTPYAVWVSEVMLQQTQVSVVVPYFERWMRRFPSIHALAEAPIEHVLKEWEGLGYYSRARHLHQGACYVLSHFKGCLPDSQSKLKEIKGLGDYTTGAILNFAFHQRKAAVDGNVLRVLARYYGIEEDISKAKTIKRFQVLAEDLLPYDEPWIISEALIELGATICSRKPKCQLCPINKTCHAYLQGKVEQLPIKLKKMTTQPLFRAVAVIVHGHRLLIRKGMQGEIMADLCEFPYFEINALLPPLESLLVFLKSKFPINLSWQKNLSSVKHSFTRYRALLIPHLFRTAKMQPIPGYEWVLKSELKKMPFSAGHRKIFEEITGSFF